MKLLERRRTYLSPSSSSLGPIVRNLDVNETASKRDCSVLLTMS